MGEEILAHRIGRRSGDRAHIRGTDELDRRRGDRHLRRRRVLPVQTRGHQPHRGHPHHRSGQRHQAMHEAALREACRRDPRREQRRLVIQADHDTGNEIT